MTGIAHDLRIALRRTLRRPALAIAIALTIGLGLGAAAAIFTTTQAALVERLPYAQPERLVHLWESRAGTGERGPTSFATLLDWRARVAAFRDIEGYDPTNVTVGIGDEARPARGARVTPGFFRLLGVHLDAGRDLSRDEDVSGGAGVALVTGRFARSAAALGRSISINGVPHRIVGVLPDDFHFALLQDADVFVPIAPTTAARADRSARSIHVVGRLQPGVPLARACGELSAAMSALAREHPDALSTRTAACAPLRDALLGAMKPVLGGLLAAVALLLVIMSANLALLMLTRYVERAPELAMRSALGATRTRVLKQLLLESLVPSIVGAALAVAIGEIATDALIAAIPDGVRSGMPWLANAGLDARVLVTIVGLAVAMAVAFGLGPALFVTKGWRRTGDARQTHARGDRRVRRGLVVAQMALTVVLLVSSGLLVVSFGTLVRRDLGVADPRSLAIVRAPLSGPRYESPPAQRRFYESLVSQSAALPGVRNAGLIDEVPGGGGGATTVDRVDRPRPRSQQPSATLRIVGGAYFPTMGVPVLAGRAFDANDREGAPGVAVVSATLARILSTDGAALGRKLRLAGAGEGEWEVVGVVGDVQVAALDAVTPPVVYLSHLQSAENRMTLVLRTRNGVASVAGGVRAIARSLDPGVPVHPAVTLDRQLGESKAIFSRRFPMILCGVFAAAALALTLVALYAISAYEVVTRRREFGIRLALGGSPAAIRRSILDDALRLGATGIAIGAVAALVVSRSLQAVLYGIAATDWRVYAAVGAGALVTALLAAAGPAARAGSVDPNVVMREG